jgi:murein DD-endopeptidase MepM/ murein hydrolase activator NlpD
MSEGYGYSVIIDHGEGKETWYNHLKGTLLQAGGFVPRGTAIGEVGSTGHSTGPHVHLEWHVNGERLDPVGFLPGSPF